jgi:hypothetical protein
MHTPIRDIVAADARRRGRFIPMPCFLIPQMFTIPVGWVYEKEPFTYDLRDFPVPFRNTFLEIPKHGLGVHVFQGQPRAPRYDPSLMCLTVYDELGNRIADFDTFEGDPFSSSTVFARPQPAGPRPNKAQFDRYVPGVVRAALQLIAQPTLYETRHVTAAERNKGRVLTSSRPRLLDYHEITIRPGATGVRSERAEPPAETGTPKCAHQVRGHYRRLRSGRMVHVRGHWRGDKSRGVVLKSYNVEAHAP